MHIDNIEAVGRLARQRKALLDYLEHFSPKTDDGSTSARVSALSFYYTGRIGESIGQIANNAGIPEEVVCRSIIDQLADLLRVRLDYVESELAHRYGVQVGDPA